MCHAHGKSGSSGDESHILIFNSPKSFHMKTVQMWYLENKEIKRGLFCGTHACNGKHIINFLGVLPVGVLPSYVLPNSPQVHLVLLTNVYRGHICDTNYCGKISAVKMNVSRFDVSSIRLIG